MCAVLIVGDRAGRADRAVHLVGPDVGPLHRLCGAPRCAASTSPLSISSARRRRIGAQRLLDVLRDRAASASASSVTLSCAAALIAFSSRSATTPTKSPIRTTATSPGISRDRGFVDRDQAGADELAGIDAGIGRAHHAAVQHAGHAHVVHIDQFAGRLGRHVDARHRLPDDAVGADGFHRDVVGELEPDGLAGDQFAVADAAVIPAADQAVLDGEFLDRQARAVRRRAPPENAAPARPPCAAARP